MSLSLINKKCKGVLSIDMKLYPDERNGYTTLTDISCDFSGQSPSRRDDGKRLS